MSVEIGSKFKSADGKTFGIVTVHDKSNIKAYLECGDEVALDDINIKSILEILFKTLNKEQQQNMLKILVEDIK